MDHKDNSSGQELTSFFPPLFQERTGSRLLAGREQPSHIQTTIFATFWKRAVFAPSLPVDRSMQGHTVQEGYRGCWKDDRQEQAAPCQCTPLGWWRKAGKG